MPWLKRGEIDILVVSTVLKLALFPTYDSGSIIYRFVLWRSKSTDFEVHRNWLAITHSLPLSKWYFDTTSEWTLDYPPFFAYFEWTLSKLAYIFDPEIVRLDNLNYQAWSVVAFQRSTVIVSELVLGTALLRWYRTTDIEKKSAFLMASAMFLHPGLLIVDHIHFQYNGFLLGILFWSLLFIRDGHIILGAMTFSSLLMFKHLYIFLAPPFFTYLLRTYCLSPSLVFQPPKFLTLAVSVLSIFTLALAPFLLSSSEPVDMIRQIIARLFPFQRGVNHAYWAGNWWALYTLADRVMVKYLRYKGLEVDEAVLSSATKGMVQDTTFGVLPTPTAGMCMGIILSLNLVYSTQLWLSPTYKNFIKHVSLSAMTSFFFGWHVHEKAALHFLLPMTLVALEDVYHLRVFVTSTFAGVYGLFPLLIHSAETPIKFLYSIAWAETVLVALRRVVYRPVPTTFNIITLNLEYLYMFGFAFLQLYTSVIHSLLETKEERMQFLPLLITSTYCALGIGWTWIMFSWLYLIG
ncbi:glycosyltransferase family 57 protein [Atractiella rhizophila]|nr:glycosyltransferase family 57 protein [Atractiella rhizophila]